MNLTDNEYPFHSEGYCKKCGQPLGIDGICSICELQEMLHSVFVCPICGMPKTHYRLYGYRCSINPEHDEMAHDAKGFKK